MATIGLLHPGAMGAAFGNQLQTQGHTVLWCPDDRSSATHRRAADAGLTAAGLPELLVRADVVLSLCPPAAAGNVADQVAQHLTERHVDGANPHRPMYVEANAITPDRVTAIAQTLEPLPTIDAAVIGSPPGSSEGTPAVLYLSGAVDHCVQVAALFEGTDIQVRNLGDGIGRASALKLLYSSYQKTSRVLAALTHAAADAHGLVDELLQIAGRRTGSYLAEPEYAPKTIARAWRWGPELDDAAALLIDAGIPGQLTKAAANTLNGWRDHRDAELDVEQAVRIIQAT